MMAYLNSDERDQLAQELVNLNFNRARGRLRRMDSKLRLGVYRNVQNVGEWMTTYDLPGRGVRITLIETLDYAEDRQRAGRQRSDFALTKVIVEPTPDNRT